jgi:hypothetical protein
VIRMGKNDNILKAMRRVMQNESLISHSEFLIRSGLTCEDFNIGVKILLYKKEMCQYEKDSIRMYCIARLEKCNDEMLFNKY